MTNISIEKLLSLIRRFEHMNPNCIYFLESCNPMERTNCEQYVYIDIYIYPSRVIIVDGIESSFIVDNQSLKHYIDGYSNDHHMRKLIFLRIWIWSD